MTTKKKKETPKKKESWVYYHPCSTLVVGDKTYKHGDSIDDWSDELREKHKERIRPA